MLASLAGLVSILTLGVALLQPRGWHVFDMAFLSLAVFFLGWRSLSLQQEGGSHLSWDGQLWCLMDVNQYLAGRVLVMWDLQAVLLLRFDPPSSEPGPSARWLWVERRTAPAMWADLRRAVYSNAPVGAH